MQVNAAQLEMVKQGDVVPLLYAPPKHRDFLHTEVTSVSLFVSASNTIGEFEGTFAAKEMILDFIMAILWNALLPPRKRLSVKGWKRVTGVPEGDIVFASA